MVVRVLAFLFLVAVPLVLVNACGQNSLAPKGGTCFQATDCQAGLFCLVADGGPGTCSDCTSCVATVPEAGGDSTVTDAPLDSPTDQVVMDNNVPDTNPQDTGPQDTGTQDAPSEAAPPMDAGTG
jgi:hypothetical protein